LQGFEVCRKFHLTPKPIPESDIERMHLLYWQWQRAWEVKFDRLREQHGDEPFNMNGDHILGDLWDWETFAEQNYQDTLPQYPTMVCLAVLLLPLLWN